MAADAASGLAARSLSSATRSGMASLLWADSTSAVRKGLVSLRDALCGKKTTLTSFSCETYAQIDSQGKDEGAELREFHDGNRADSLTAVILLVRELCQVYDNDFVVNLGFSRLGHLEIRLYEQKDGEARDFIMEGEERRH